MLYIDDKEQVIGNFPAGEQAVKLQDVKKQDSYEILWRYENDSEFIALALLVDALRRNYYPKDGITLTVPYLPYARQDRMCHEGEPFSLSFVMSFLKSLKFNAIVTYDIHSDVALHMYPELRVRGMEWFATDIYNLLPPGLVLCAPDKGATKKVQKLRDCMNHTRFSRGNVTSVYALKKRVGEEVHTVGLKGEVKDKDVLIADDICDGGATFIGLAKLLKEKGAKSVSLYVTHGIFSKPEKGINELFKYIDKIFTANLCTKNPYARGKFKQCGLLWETTK